MKIEDLDGSDFCGLMAITYLFAAVFSVIAAFTFSGHDQRMQFERLVDKGYDPIALKCAETINDWRTVSSTCLYYVLPRREALRTAAIINKARKANGM